jgi:hypothetical protein
MSLHYNSKLSCAKNSETKLAVSVVVTTTNTAPKDQIERLKIQLNNIQHFISKYNLLEAIEVVIVEYTFDAAQPPLMEMVKPMLNASMMPLVRVLRVPSRMHDMLVSRLGVSFKVIFLEFVAKNIGIRRSCGAFILCTNADIVFHESFFSFLSNNRLNSSYYYRMPRCNCQINQAELYNITPEDVVSRLKNSIQSCWWCMPPPEAWKTYASANWSQSAKADVMTSKECIMAPGDFTMLSKDDYLRYKGYPELALPSVLDDVPIWQAMADGKLLAVIPKPSMTFHINHQKPYAQSDGRYPNSDLMSKTYRLQEIGQKMMQDKKLITFNDDNWGLEGILLHEDFF